jgi:hypothetical protein
MTDLSLTTTFQCYVSYPLGRPHTNCVKTSIKTWDKKDKNWCQHHDSDRCAAVFIISFVLTVLLPLLHVQTSCLDCYMSWRMPVCGLPYTLHNEAKWAEEQKESRINKQSPVDAIWLYSLSHCFILSLLSLFWKDESRLMRSAYCLCVWIHPYQPLSGWINCYENW